MIAAIASRLRHRGPRELLRLAAMNVAQGARAVAPAAWRQRRTAGAFDRRWGTDTRGGVSVHDLGFGADRIDHCRRYDPSEEAMLRAPVAMLGLDPADFAFVDYGAGKGRMVMLAMELGFAGVTGVELSKRLCAIARTNVARFAARHEGMAVPIIAETDAAAFVPGGRAILAYFYNPFDAIVMADVRDRLDAALRQGTERVVVVYANPEHGAVFREAPGWREAPAPVGVALFLAG